MINELNKKLVDLVKESLTDNLLKENTFKNYILDKAPLDLLYFNLYTARRKLQKMTMTDNYPAKIINEQESKIKTMEQEISNRLFELERVAIN